MKYVFVICSALLSVSAIADSNIPVNQAVELCRAEQNALRRLTCYDAIEPTSTNSSDTKTGALQANAQTQQDEAKTAENNDTRFGLEHKAQADADETLRVTVKSISYTPHNKLIIEFENGQRWRQIGTEYYSVAVGQQHTIKRGVLNSFFLANDNNNRTIRIKREQ
ncbi:MAG: hypothetical protein LPK11_02595 [Chromatiaceae bacterium]|nr:hypothetical protein [Chromatiaceae bacterium]